MLSAPCCERPIFELTRAGFASIRNGCNVPVADLNRWEAKILNNWQVPIGGLSGYNQVGVLTAGLKPILS